MEFSRVEIFARAVQRRESGHKHGLGKTVIVLYTVFSDSKLKTNSIYNYTLNTDQQCSQMKAVKSTRKKEPKNTKQSISIKFKLTKIK